MVINIHMLIHTHSACRARERQRIDSSYFSFYLSILSLLQRVTIRSQLTDINSSNVELKALTVYHRMNDTTYHLGIYIYTMLHGAHTHTHTHNTACMYMRIIHRGDIHVRERRGCALPNCRKAIYT